jgi:sialic acid synthase SpsE
MNIKLSSSFVVKNNSRPYIVAEIGSNHNGDMKLCKKIIDAAKKSGADCVKFQYFSIDSIFSKKTYKDNYFISDDYRNRKDVTLKEIVKKYSITIDQLKEMKNYCREIKIDFLVTPFSHKESDDLVNKLRVETFKIASMDLNNYDFLDYIARKGKTIVLSTGLSDLSEIDKAVKTIENTGNKKLIILHCVAIYPPNYDQINLNRIVTLKNLYPYPIGFSDHSPGYEVSLAAIALGACFIEKHFTIDKKMAGWDHHMSIDDNDMLKLVDGAKKVFQSLGDFRIRRVESKERVVSFRRSVVSSRKILKGEIIKREDLDLKRPGTGLPPEKLKDIIGKTAKKDINYDELISFEDY